MLRLPLRPLLWLSIALSGPGCVVAPTATLRGYPLYSSGAAPRLPGNQVAQLSAALPGGASPGGGSGAFIKSIDGRDVAALDTAFELLPGCHIVQTESRLRVANEMISWTGELGTLTFPFRMKAGHEYTVVVELAEGLGGTARVAVYGVERDPSGAQTQVIPAAKSAGEVQACRTGSAPGS